MTGEIEVTYAVLCDKDVSVEVTLEQIMENPACATAIRKAFAKTTKTIEQSIVNGKVLLQSTKTPHKFTLPKDSYMDMVDLTEEHARKLKQLKKGCERVEILDYETLPVKNRK